MSTQPSPVNPAIPPHLEPYVDSKRAAVFLALDWKKVQKLSREGKIPAHPVLSGPATAAELGGTSSANLTSGLVLSETPAGGATSPKEK